MFLKEISYYENLYDRLTVDECRDIEKRFSETTLPKYKGKTLSKDEQERCRKSFSNVYLWFVKGGRYANKEKRVREWMDDDRRRDEKYANATFEKIPKTAIKAAKETLKPNEFYLHPPAKPPRIRKVVPHPKENAAISKWHSEYKDFNEVAKVFHRTRRSQDKMIQYLNKVPKSKTFNTLLSGLYFFPKSTAVAIAVTGAGLGVAKGGLAGNMVLRRVLSNPIWAAYYEKAVQKMLSDNAAGAYKILKHLEKELDHEEK